MSFDEGGVKRLVLVSLDDVFNELVRKVEEIVLRAKICGDELVKLFVCRA